jgi:hypothetical protein
MGSLIKVGSYLINQDGKTGEIVLIEPSPDAYKELARASFSIQKSRRPGRQWLSAAENCWCAIWRKWFVLTYRNRHNTQTGLVKSSANIGSIDMFNRIPLKITD